MNPSLQENIGVPSTAGSFLLGLRSLLDLSGGLYDEIKLPPQDPLAAFEADWAALGRDWRAVFGSCAMQDE